MRNQHSPKSRLAPLAWCHETWWTMGLTVAMGVISIGLGARLEVPMVPVPMSMQTYAVMVVAALAGSRLGVAVVLVYLAAAAAGAPLLAGGASGVERLWGNTAGYLVGFVAAAALVGWFAETSWTRRGLLRASLVMLIGHGVILFLGTAWLGTRLGWLPALQHGLLPFLVGAVAKSILAAATIEGLRRISRRPGSRSA